MPSSVIAAMEYEPARHTLLIAYRGGRGVYRYFDVSEREWNAFLRARSKGRYLNREFKRKAHPYVKLDVQNAGDIAASEAGAVFFWPARGSIETPG